MDGRGKISEYRSKLDRTLASPDLTNDEMVHALVKNQILQSMDSKLGVHNDYLVERRSKEVFDFLSELRSASVNDERLTSGDESHKGWKVKQDTHELRVMYREGPEGTPFHSLLCEGYVDGRVDVCLCISCESDLYKKWWPQITVPTFRILSSQCVQKVRIGEQISVVRMKLMWPMSSREALVHYFVFNYLQDGLVVVLIKSIPDSENIDRSTHGFTRDGIPEPQDVVRMDLFGGFALQKVTSDRSYFRTIANMDIKLDIVPPMVINFIARQLVGSGFKLYKKEIASVSKGDGKFQEALKDPLYTRIHEALYSQNASMASLALDEAFEDTNAKEKDDANIDSEDKDVTVRDRKVFDEIEEFKERDSDKSESLDEGNQKSHDNLTDEITEEVTAGEMEVNSWEIKQGHEIIQHFGHDVKSKVCVSPEVQQALETLEKAILIIREGNSSPGKVQSKVKKDNWLNLGGDEKKGTCVESSKIGSAELTSHAPRNSSDNHGSRHKGSNSYARETNQSKIAPASPDEGHLSLSHVTDVDLLSLTIPDNKTDGPLLCADPHNGNKMTNRKNKKARFCCLSFSS